MRNIFILFVTLLANGTATADQRICNQLGHMGYVIAQYRDRGIDELETTEIYLALMQPYREQVIVLALIDRVYNLEHDLYPEEVAYTEQDLCLIKIKQRFISRQ